MTGKESYSFIQSLPEKVTQSKDLMGLQGTSGRISQGE